MLSPVGRGPKISTLPSCQEGHGGKTRDVIWEPWQTLHNCSTSLSKPDHQTLPRRHYLVCTTLWWPSCASFKTLSQKDFETTFLVPRRQTHSVLNFRTGRFRSEDQKLVDVRSSTTHFSEKSSSRERDLEMWVLHVQLIKNHQDNFFVKCVIHTQHYCGHYANLFLENTKKTRVKKSR